MKFAVAFALALSSTSASAGSYFACVSQDRRDITFLVDFENGTLDTASTLQGKGIAHDDMIQKDPAFINVGESYLLMRTARFEDGQIELRKTEGGQITGFYQGALTLGHRFNFSSCQEEQD